MDRIRLCGYFCLSPHRLSQFEILPLACGRGGKALSALTPSVRGDTVVNRKMTSLYPVPIAYFIGTKVRKKFGGKWCTGTVDCVDTDEGETLRQWYITYED